MNNGHINNDNKSDAVLSSIEEAAMNAQTMNDAADFLLEIGTGELPPDQVESIARQLAELLQRQLNNLGVSEKSGGQEAEIFYTPRRVAVLIKGVIARRPDREQLVRGPAVKVAFDQNNQPTLASIKFAKSCGVEASDLSIGEDQSGGSFVFAKKVIAGYDTITLLPDAIKQAVHAITFKRGMYWGDGIGPFVRPVKWILALFGSQVIPVTLFGVVAGGVSYGHRIHNPEPFIVKNPADYEELLGQNCVLPSPARRREIILDKLRGIDGTVVDEQLLEETVNLVEWPDAVECRFDPRFLNMPQEIIVTSLKHHQRCFATQNEEGKLDNRFVAVINLISSDPKQVVAGNELVVKARLEDAEYFYQQDLKHRLTDYLEMLKSRVFFKDLGSLYDKSVRNAELADIIASLLSVPQDACKTAALYAKCDLACQVVGEFPELQGVMGGCYARLDGYDSAVATAIGEHYLPRFAGDEVPESIEGCIVSLADRIDSLVGLFSVGQQPTGEKDPLALRRMAMGVVRIAISKNLSLDLHEVILQAISNYPHLRSSDGKIQELIAQIMRFLSERIQTWYAEYKINPVWVKAILSASNFNLSNVHGLVLALNEFMHDPKAQQLLSAYKRVHNLLQKQAAECFIGTVDPALFESESESKLFETLKEVRQTAVKRLKERQYGKVLISLLEFSAPLANFLEQVRVISEDEKRTRNRLIMMQELEHLMLAIVDFGYLVSGSN